MGLVFAAPAAAEMHVWWSGPRNVQQVALTFDDVPLEPYTTQVLAILKRYDIKATFFVIGKHARQSPGVVEQILKAGHQVANHTESHLNLAQKDIKTIRAEILGLQKYMEERFGVIPAFFRPPHGAISFEVMATVHSAGMDVALWDVDPQDWNEPGSLNITRRVANQVQPGSILLLHTLNTQIVECLPVLIEYLKLENYSFATLAAMTGKPAYRNSSEAVTADGLMTSDTGATLRTADKDI